MASQDSARKVIGKPPNHWLYDVSSSTFDLTRPLPPRFLVPSPAASTSIETTTKKVVISPRRTALVIIDMQNFFLSTYLGRSVDGAGNRAAQTLLETTIPAARDAGIQLIWLNWGLTEREIEEMPPTLLRGFGFEASLDHQKGKGPTEVSNSQGTAGPAEEHLKEDTLGDSKGATQDRRSARIFQGLGSEIGTITIEDDKVINAGRLLMRHTWNADLPPPLKAAFLEGQQLKEKPDVWIPKNRTSGFWGGTTPCIEHLENEGIRTLLFAGVNTDQCVGGSLQDAFLKGWDCILLKDACGTTSPEFATECIEYNCARNWGFVTDCQAFKKGVQTMLDARSDTNK